MDVNRRPDTPKSLTQQRKFETYTASMSGVLDSRLIPSLDTYFFETLATCIAPVCFAIPHSIMEQNVRIGLRHTIDLATYIKHEPAKPALVTYPWVSDEA